MSDIVSLTSRKDKKKAQEMIFDLEAAIIQMDASIGSLKPYGKYSFVAESISSLTTNRTLLEIHRNKLKKLCE